MYFRVRISNTRIMNSNLCSNSNANSNPITEIEGESCVFTDSPVIITKR